MNTESRVYILLLSFLLVACRQNEPPSVATRAIDAATTPSEPPVPTQTPEPTPTAPMDAVPTADGTPVAPDEGEVFVLLQPDPVIMSGDGGDWSAPLQNPGAVIYHDGFYHMFRNGYQSLPGNADIGYATSPDGVDWTDHPGNPILRTADVPYGGIMIMANSVTVAEDGTWFLYFLIWPTEETPGAIGRATAPAPTGPWTPDPEPVLHRGPIGSWDEVGVTRPSVLPNGSGFVMYYTGVDGNGIERIGLARSQDGRVWTKYDDPTTTFFTYRESDPLLQSDDSGEWDAGGTAGAQVVSTPQGYLMVYHSSAEGGGYNYGLALSHDGFNWTKFSGNPIFERSDIPGSAGPWFPALVQAEEKSSFFIESGVDAKGIQLFHIILPATAFATAAGKPVPGASDLAALDVANANNAADIEVRFSPDPFIGEQPVHQAIVTLRGETLDLEQALSLGSDRTVTVAISAASGGGRLPASMPTASGDAIAEGVEYDLYLLTKSSYGAVLNGPAPLSLSNEAVVRTLVKELPSATGGLALGPDGLLYVANIGPVPSRGGEDIYRISTTGEVELWVSGQGLSGASGNSFDGDGNLIQSSFNGNNIHRITPDGTVTELASDGVRGPVGVTIDSQGALAIANCGGRDILHVTPDGTSTVLAEGPPLNCPNGITHDEDGNLYVANFNDGRVIKISPAGEVSELVDVPGRNNGHIIYHNGSLYIVARGENRVYELTPTGDLVPLAGSGEQGHEDGPALEASFARPNDIVYDEANRRFYVNEVLPLSGSANIPSRIRVIELPRMD